MKIVLYDYRLAKYYSFVTWLTFLCIILSCTSTSFSQSTSLTHTNISLLDSGNKKLVPFKILIAKNLIYFISEGTVHMSNGKAFTLLKEDKAFKDYHNFILDRNENIWIIKTVGYSDYKIEVFISAKKDIIPLELYTDVSKLNLAKKDIREINSDDKSNLYILYKDGSIKCFKDKFINIDITNVDDYLNIKECDDTYTFLAIDSVQIRDQEMNLLNTLTNSYENYDIQSSDSYDCILYSKEKEKIHVSFWTDGEKVDSMSSEITYNNYHQSTFRYHEPSDNFLAIREKKIEILNGNNQTIANILDAPLDYYLDGKNEIGDNIVYLSSKGLSIISHSNFKFSKISHESESTRDIEFINDSIMYYSSYSGQFLYNKQSKEHVKLDPTISGYGHDKIVDTLAIKCGHNASLHWVNYNSYPPTTKKIEANILGTGSAHYKLPAYDSKNNTLWFANKFNIISIANFLPPKERYQTFHLIPEEEGAYIRDILCTDKACYFATSKGLKISTDGKNLKPISLTETTVGISCIKKHKDKFYLGTEKGQILILDTELNLLEILDQNQGLSNERIYTIEFDDQNNIWCGTEMGLCYIKFDFSRIVNFTTEEGLPDNDFNYESSAKSPDGLLYFGTQNGIVEFNPEEIISNLKEGDFEIILAEISKKKNPSQFEVYNGNVFKLTEQDATLKLMLSAKSEGLLKANEIQYKISNIDNFWKTSSNGIIEISDLDYGKHELQIRSVNALDKTTSVEIESVAPFYTRTWGYLLMALIGISFYALFKNRKARSFRKRSEKLEKEVEKRTIEINSQKDILEQNNNAKDKIFSILAHDLRTPVYNLSQLSESIDYLIQENRLAELKVLSKEAKNKAYDIKSLVDNLLHWSLQQQNKIFLAENTFKIIGPIEETIEHFKKQISDKNLNVIVNVDPGISITTDHSAFEAVFRNILSNAIKFSYKEGEVIINAQESNAKIDLSIKDFGVGLTEKQIENINKNSYITTAGPYEEKGIGIGLMLSKYFLEKMGANLSISSIKNESTELKIEFKRA